MTPFILLVNFDVEGNPELGVPVDVIDEVTENIYLGYRGSDTIMIKNVGAHNSTYVFVGQASEGLSSEIATALGANYISWANAVNDQPLSDFLSASGLGKIRLVSDNSLVCYYPPHVFSGQDPLEISLPF